MKYRSRQEIIQNLLLILEIEPSKKTNLMYGAMLSFEQMKEYGQLLLDKGLMANNGKIFHLTAKGAKALSLFRELNELLSVNPEVETKVARIAEIRRTRFP